MIGSKHRTAVLAGGLAVAIVLGSVSTGFAATAANSAPAQAVASCGIGVGSAVRSAGGRLLDVVAKLTGQTTTQVAAERASGKTFTQIAADKNVSSTTLVSEALKVREQVLTTKVKAGSITQSQADTALARMKTRVTERLTDPSACTGTGPGTGTGTGAGSGARNGGGSGAGTGSGTGRGAGGSGRGGGGGGNCN
jgi:hypothetical protein